MSARFWIGGTGNWDGVDTTHWSTSSGGAGGASAPGASDDVTFDGSSGGGTITMTATQSVNSITGGAHTGTFNTNGQTLTVVTFNYSGTGTRTLTLGSSTINVTGASTTAWDISTNTNLTLTANTATITLSGAGVTAHFGNGKTYGGTIAFTGSGQAQNNGNTTFANLTRTGTAAKTDSFKLGANFTVTGTLTLNGNSTTNRILVFASSVGTQNTITNTGATMSWSNVDFQDIALSSAYNASAITGGCGDAGGNSGITFTTPATQTWSGTSGGNWSSNAWSGRVPLPQDDVVISSAFSASQTVVADMPRLGKSINWTGSTGTPAFNLGLSCSLFGSLTLISGMTRGGFFTLTFAGRTSGLTITTAGISIGPNWDLIFQGPGSTYTLQDALDDNGKTITVNDGTFVTNGFSVTAALFVSNNGRTRAITLGSSVVSLGSTAAAAPWNTAASGLTFSGASSTIIYTAASANTRQFNGSGFTYGTLTYIVAGSTGKLTVSGSNTFGNLNFSDASNARTLEFTAGTTTTIIGNFNVNGTSGKLMSVVSATGGSAFTLTKSGGVISCDYLSIQDSTATGGATWKAGLNSTNVSGNTGWIWYKALSFGGDTSYVAAGTADPTAGSFSIGGWLQWNGSPNTANSPQAIISKHTSFGTQRWWLGLDKLNSYKFLVYGDGGAFPFWNYIPPSDGTKIHFVWVHNSGVNEKLYINGAFHSNISSISLGSATTAPIIIGASTNGTAERLKGVLDCMFINTTALSADNISGIYNGLNPNTLSGAWATWHFDEGTGTSTADQTGTNTGTLSGATLPTWVPGIEKLSSISGGLTMMGIG